MKRLIVILFVIGFISGCGNHPLQGDEGFALPWRKPDAAEAVIIRQCLEKRDVHGCDEYYLRQQEKDKSEYLIGCQSDSSNWNYYIVSTKSGSAIRLVSDRIQAPGN